MTATTRDQAIDGLRRLVRRWPLGKTSGAAVLRPAWDAWRDGDFETARLRASDVLASDTAPDEARHVLLSVASVLGRYREAIDLRAAIDERYRSMRDLDETVLWAYLHTDDLAGALAFAERSSLAREESVLRRLRFSLDNPMQVHGDGVVALPFVEDALTPFMPGLAARVNGIDTVARIDTGGSFVNLSADMADRFGIETVASERGFASLVWNTVRYGIGDIELGPVTMRNVPVAVHDGALPTNAVAEAFGVELGPIIGTNVLRRFLSTIDARGGRLILTRRDDAEACDTHRAMIAGAEQVPFGLWGEHLMIAGGHIGEEAVNFFVDSGLVAVTDEAGQAALLAHQDRLAGWGASPSAGGPFATLPRPLALGSIARSGLTAFPVPGSTWRALGDWGGIRVDALVSWGFLREFVWTIDFDRFVYHLGHRLVRPGSDA